MEAKKKKEKGKKREGRGEKKGDRRGGSSVSCRIYLICSSPIFAISSRQLRAVVRKIILEEKKRGKGERERRFSLFCCLVSYPVPAANGCARERK